MEPMTTFHICKNIYNFLFLNSQLSLLKISICLFIDYADPKEVTSYLLSCNRLRSDQRSRQITYNNSQPLIYDAIRLIRIADPILCFK